ncbi:MAG: sulfate adenylyltransferase [Gammaproteobacteria bacterium]|jgi:sulfate adenylyltransferase|nr:sulfate adenylyltransferase [Gammaproteobacteria bacterium]MBT7603966.1 sulfate adenylyltransferase [Gammaproteobacteria bacterium]
MIKPHGSEELLPKIVNTDEEKASLLDSSKSMKKILVNSAAAANLVMLGAGYFTPLEGFMSKKDVISVADNMTLENGLFWPTPVVNLTNQKINFNVGDKIALIDPNVEGDKIIAIQSVDEIETLSSEEIDNIINKVFGTNDRSHPGVQTFYDQGNTLISGKVSVINFSYFETDFGETFRTAMQIRSAIELKGWKNVVAFQTRNPMHRAHEELCRMAGKRVNADGILIHMLLGKLKPGDIPADVRDSAIRTMVDHYFPKDYVMITGYGFDMLYAGPREALLHAVFRQNCGCSYLIVGRDHAGVGDFYGAFDAQEIFDKIPNNALLIKIFNADHTAYSKKLNKVVMMRDVEDHTKEDFVILSGTKVREMLSRGENLPKEFARPEVAEVLMKHYIKGN